MQNDQVLVSTCRMHTYNFPFDIQSCNLSFKSVIHTGEYYVHTKKHLYLFIFIALKNNLKVPRFTSAAKELRLQPSDNSSEATEWSRGVMRTQYEWLFINMTITANNASNPEDQDIVVYTVCMSTHQYTKYWRVKFIFHS